MVWHPPSSAPKFCPSIPFYFILFWPGKVSAWKHESFGKKVRSAFGKRAWISFEKKAQAFNVFQSKTGSTTLCKKGKPWIHATAMEKIEGLGWVGCRSWLCKGTPKMMKIFTNNVDFQYWFLSPKTYENILILETPKINIKYWFPLKINIGFQILIVINIGCSGHDVLFTVYMYTLNAHTNMYIYIYRYDDIYNIIYIYIYIIPVWISSRISGGSTPLRRTDFLAQKFFDFDERLLLSTPSFSTEQLLETSES